MGIELPDLLSYRADYQSEGVDWPLKTISFQKEGLLSRLPHFAGNKTGWPWDEQVDPNIFGRRDEWPRLTIVTPSYNQADFLETTIRSVLLQNYPNLEYIIIDGGSTDGSADIIRKYTPWLSFWESKKDRGQGHAINKGFSLASGRYYAWINSDDHYLPGSFFKVTGQFHKTGAAFIYGYVSNFVKEKAQFDRPTTMAPLLDYFIRIPTLAQPACFWRSTIHQPIWEALHCSLDYELWLRLVKGNKRKIMKQPLAVAVIHEDAKTSDPKMKDKWEEDHLRICGESAHGSVNNWDKIMRLHRIRMKIYRWLRLT
jgi:glycosyltransferase involved in cell wall biosynthesis